MGGGAVRTGQAGHQSERLIARMRVDELAGFHPEEMVPGGSAGEPVDDGAMVLEVAVMLAAVQLQVPVPIEVVAVAVLYPEPPLALAGHAVLEPVAGLPRIEVHLAVRGHVATRRGEDLWPDRRRPLPGRTLGVVVVIHHVALRGIAEPAHSPVPVPAGREPRSSHPEPGRA